jgi:hypothetical protein
MMNGARNEPMLKAIGLWEQTSNKVKRSLTGRLGGMKVLMLENRDRQSDDDPSYHLFFVEAPDWRQGGQEQAQDRGDGHRAPATQMSQTPSEAQRRSFQAQAPLDHDDAPEWAR